MCKLQSSQVTVFCSLCRPESHREERLAGDKGQHSCTALEFPATFVSPAFIPFPSMGGLRFLKFLNFFFAKASLYWFLLCATKKEAFTQTEKLKPMISKHAQILWEETLVTEPIYTMNKLQMIFQCPKINKITLRKS